MPVENSGRLYPNIEEFPQPHEETEVSSGFSVEEDVVEIVLPEDEGTVRYMDLEAEADPTVKGYFEKAKEWVQEHKVLSAVIVVSLTVVGLVVAKKLFSHSVREVPMCGKPIQHAASGFTQVVDRAQYKYADWSNMVGQVQNISLEEAKTIAKLNKNVTYFFYMKGGPMSLEMLRGGYRTFFSRTAVFFSGTPHLGTAIGYADTYIKG